MHRYASCTAMKNKHSAFHYLELNQYSQLAPRHDASSPAGLYVESELVNVRN